MKNKILTFCLLLISAFTEINAQQYQSCFGVESTKWIIVCPTSWWGMEKTLDPGYFNFDTIMCYGWYSIDNYENIVYFESEGNSKLWRWNMRTNERNIIMDLNWEVGDTIYIETKEFLRKYEERPYAIVDTVFYDNYNRKIVHTDLVFQLDTTYFNLKFIESIGPNTSIYIKEEYGMFWGMSDLLLCAYKDDVLVYNNTEAGGECSYNGPDSNPTNKTINQVTITLHKNTIELIFDDTFSGKLCLITANGKVIKKETINRKNKTINIEDVPDGFYIAQVTDRTGKYCVAQKITKTKAK
jgi:hypothetical protein